MNYPDNVRRLPDDEVVEVECSKCSNLIPSTKDLCESCLAKIDEDDDYCSICGGHSKCGDSYCNLCCDCDDDD